LTADENHRRVLDLGAHHGARRIGDAGSQGGNAQSRRAGHAAIAFGHEAHGEFVVRSHHRPAAFFRLDEHMNEIRVRNSE
jgi:hypothetical protein